jgi:hypothetical protein
MVEIRRHLLLSGSLLSLLFLLEGGGGIFMLYTYESICDYIVLHLRG